MENNRPDNIQIRNARIINKNFEGKEEKPYNPKGSRYFTVLLTDEEFIRLLAADGWNVKVKENEDGTVVAYLKVSVGYNNPSMLPKIVQITEKDGKKKKTFITESTVASIDSSDIENVSLEIRPRIWYDSRTKEYGGIKAYLKTMYYDLVKDPFEDEYDVDVPDVGGLPFDPDVEEE